MANTTLPRVFLCLWHNYIEAMTTNLPIQEHKILVVDDERSLVNLCLLIFEQAGYQARGAFSGKQALKLAGEEMPDLILLDIMMPGMDGIEACRQILDLASAKRPTILMYTADDRQQTKVNSLNAGATDLISKETPIFDLPQKIDRFLNAYAPS